MRSLFKKYYLTVSAFHFNENGVKETTDEYYLDKSGRLSKTRPMKDNARVFGYIKGAVMVRKVKKIYDASKWAVSLVPVHEMDFVNYIQLDE